MGCPRAPWLTVHRFIGGSIRRKEALGHCQMSATPTHPVALAPCSDLRGAVSMLTSAPTGQSLPIFKLRTGLGGFRPKTETLRTDTAGFHAEDRLSCTRDRVSRTKDRVSRTKDRVSRTKDHVSRAKDHVSRTKDHVSRTEDYASRTEDRVSLAKD